MAISGCRQSVAGVASNHVGRSSIYIGKTDVSREAENDHCDLCPAASDWVTGKNFGSGTDWGFHDNWLSNEGQSSDPTPYS